MLDYVPEIYLAPVACRDSRRGCARLSHQSGGTRIESSKLDLVTCYSSDQLLPQSLAYRQHVTETTHFDIYLFHVSSERFEKCMISGLFQLTAFFNFFLLFLCKDLLWLCLVVRSSVSSEFVSMRLMSQDGSPNILLSRILEHTLQPRSSLSHSCNPTLHFLYCVLKLVSSRMGLSQHTHLSCPHTCPYLQMLQEYTITSRQVAVGFQEIPVQTLGGLSACSTFEKVLQDLVLLEASDETSRFGNSSSDADSMCKECHTAHASKARGLT